MRAWGVIAFLVIASLVSPSRLPLPSGTERLLGRVSLRTYLSKQVGSLLQLKCSSSS